jgi:vacuolar-type H+-ATPase subunit E/Vma4
MADEHLERLLAELGERAKSEIAQATTAGQAEAERILSAARANAHERMVDAVGECESEQARSRATAIAVARRRARRALLEAQHAFVNRALACGAQLVTERLRAAGPQATQARVDALMSYTSESDAQVRRGDDGIRLTADGGHLRIDDTVSAWLEQNRSELVIAICRAAEPERMSGPG